MRHNTTHLLGILSLVVTGCAAGQKAITWNPLSSDPRWPILLAQPVPSDRSTPVPIPTPEETEAAVDNPFANKPVGRVMRFPAAAVMGKPARAGRTRPAEKKKSTLVSSATGTDVLLKQLLETDGTTRMEVRVEGGALLRLDVNTKGRFRYLVTQDVYELWLRNNTRLLTPQLVFEVEGGRVLSTVGTASASVIPLITPQIELVHAGSQAAWVQVSAQGSEVAVADGAVLVSLRGKLPMEWHTYVAVGERLLPDQVGKPEIGSFDVQPVELEALPAQARFFLNKVDSKTDRNYLALSSILEKDPLFKRLPPLPAELLKKVVDYRKRQQNNWPEYCRFRNRFRSDQERSRRLLLGISAKPGPSVGSPAKAP